MATLLDILHKSDFDPIIKNNPSNEFETQLFEFPVTDKMRQFLKIEHLSNGIAYHMHQDSSWGVQACVSLLFELTQLLEKSDIKGKALQELDRIRKNIEANSSDLQDKTTSLKLLALQASFDTLNMLNGPFNLFNQSEFTIMLRQRFSTSQSQCSFESPAFYQFSTQNIQDRVKDIKHLILPILPLLSSISLILKLTREAGMVESVTASSGRFEKQLNSKNPLQLVQIKVTPGHKIYPELSSGKHQLFVNFVQQLNGPKKNVEQDVAFQILCSSL